MNSYTNNSMYTQKKEISKFIISLNFLPMLSGKIIFKSKKLCTC